MLPHNGIRATQIERQIDALRPRLAMPELIALSGSALLADRVRRELEAHEAGTA